MWVWMIACMAVIGIVVGLLASVVEGKRDSRTLLGYLIGFIAWPVVAIAAVALYDPPQEPIQAAEVYQTPK